VSITLQSIPDGSTDYPAIVEANFAEIESTINTLLGQVSAVGGEAAQLIHDVFDRDGIVGAQSYQLDLANYAGGSTITIGRRPAQVVGHGDQNVSVAWGTFGGIKKRVTLTGDFLLDAMSVPQTSLPKTIYIIIPSDGTPQFTDSAIQANSIYAYSMTWDGYAIDVDTIKRMCSLLGANETLKALHNDPQILQVTDESTDWLSDTEGKRGIFLPGGSVGSGIAIEGSKRVVGGFVAIDAGFLAEAGDDNKLVLEVLDDEDRRWNLEDIEIDCSQSPDYFLFTIDEDAIGNDVFVTTSRRFRLSRVSVGEVVSAAQGFTWGLHLQPVLGTPVAKDLDKVSSI
jgi:hypothetical protein